MIRQTPLVVALLISAVFALTEARTETSLRLATHPVARGLLTIPSIEDVKATCKTSAKATVFLDATGKVDVKAHSSCKAFATSISNVENIVKEFIRQVEHVPLEGCTTVRVEEVIHLCAQAIAKVYTEASVAIKVQGDATACATATAEGDAFAKAYAALLVNLWLGVTTGESSADAEAQVGALTYVLSEVWAAAKVAKCQKGTGSVKDFEKSVAEQVRVALTCVTAELAVKLCDVAFAGQATVKDDCSKCNSGELKSFLAKTESTAEVGVCSSTQTLVDNTKGDAKTIVRDAAQCKGKIYDECCKPFYGDKKECLCGRKCHAMKHVDSGFWYDIVHPNKLCYCSKPDLEKPSHIVATKTAESAKVVKVVKVGDGHE